MEQIAVMVKKPGEEPRLEEHFPNRLEAYQEAVGGFIEAVTLASDLVILCNEEGRLLGLPFNVNLCGIDFYGPVVAVGVEGEDFAGLSDDMIPKVQWVLMDRKAEVLKHLESMLPDWGKR